MLSLQVKRNVKNKSFEDVDLNLAVNRFKFTISHDVAAHFFKYLIHIKSFSKAKRRTLIRVNLLIRWSDLRL